MALTVSGCTLNWIRPSVANQPFPQAQAKSVPDVPFETSKVDLAASNAEIENFTRQLQDLIKARNFAELDAMAAKYRDSKERFIGGGWKIHSFYSMLSGPSTGDKEADWESHLAFLQDWKKTQPSSIAAPLSLANSYIGFAWLVRGDDVADKVPESAWPIVHARLDAAEGELAGISNQEMDPYGYFEVAENLARVDGWDPNKFDKTFSEAIKFDPTYQYFYASKASFLLPRWSGKPGEWEAFAEETKQKIGGEDGFKMYYMIVAEVFDYKGYRKGEIFKGNLISWPGVRLGFQLYEKQYGMTRSKLNQFASMTLYVNDIPTMCKTFDQLTSDDFNPEYWSNRDGYLKYLMMMKVVCKNAKVNPAP